MGVLSVKKEIIIVCDIYDPTRSKLCQEWESKESIQILHETILELGYNVQIISNRREILSYLLSIPKESRKDVLLFNLIEGYSSPNREGYIPSLAEFLGFPHSGSSASLQSLTLNKYYTQMIAKEIGIPVASSFLLTTDSLVSFNAKLQEHQLDFPLFLKPNGEGSSLGITDRNIIQRESDLIPLLNNLILEFGEILVESFLDGPDLTIGVLGNFPDYKISPPAYVRFPDSVYSEIIKGKGEATETLDFNVPIHLSDDLKMFSLKFAENFRSSGYLRLDFKIHGSIPHLIDANGTPGLSKIYSSFPKLFERAGFTYVELIRNCIDLGYSEFEQNKRFLYGKTEG